MRIIFATENEHKMHEIREILADLGAEILSLRDLGIKAEAEENGTTFAQNAEIKAREIFTRLIENQSGGEPAMVMADDSGLCIDALDGAPGVHSARFMGHGTSYRIKNEALLEQLKDVPDAQRGAQFVCDICAILPDGRALHAEGVMEGQIAHEIAGANGFGYDPIFYLPSYGKTSAELSEAEKNSISHRGKALGKMRALLEAEG